MSEKISIREFARRVKVSDTAIRKAIKKDPPVIRFGVAYDEKGRPEILYDIALKEWNDAAGGVDRETIGDKTEVEIPVTKKSDVPKVPSKETGSGMSLVEAKRQAAVFDAKKKGLELLKLQGSLVSKDKVYSALFSFGQEIKTNLQAIPDKWIDNILACTSRQEAHAMLYKALTDALENLSRLSDQDLLTEKDIE